MSATTNSNNGSNNSSSSIGSSNNISPIEAEYNDIDGRQEWNQAYHIIKQRSEQEAKDCNFSVEESNQNLRLNRYRDVNPYDHSRIILHRGDSDYINANLVKMDRANRKYILTQGPLSGTLSHFWTMVWEQNSKAILMLNKIVENKQIKCHMYWPEQRGRDNQLILSDVGLTIEYLRCEDYCHYTKRLFLLTDTESMKSREVIQFHYNTWPDFGIPSSPIAFLQFLKQVRDSGALNSDVGPAIVHCSAGIGRSGTFCLVDSCLVLVDKEGENNVSVPDVLLELRRYRTGLIQTSDQLYFSYKAIIEGIKHFNDPSFKDYDEVPVIPHEIDENIPPPMPPPRGESLAAVKLKELPPIPYSVSAHELNTANANIINENNTNGSGATININNTTNKTSTTTNKSTTNNTHNQNNNHNHSNSYELRNNIDRPLPPLPKDLEKIDEPVTTDEDQLNSGDDNDDDDDNDDNDDNADLNNDHHKMVNNDSEESDNDDVDDDGSKASESSSPSSGSADDDDDGNNLRSKQQKLMIKHMNHTNNALSNNSSFDANAALPPSPTTSSSTASAILTTNANTAATTTTTTTNAEHNDELNINDPTQVRRRKRMERNQTLETHVKDIRRKQRAVEEEAARAPKKRRNVQLAFANKTNNKSSRRRRHRLPVVKESSSPTRQAPPPPSNGE